MTEDRKRLLLVVVASAVLFFSFLWSVGLSETDGARYPEVAREMIAGHDYITPRINGIDFFDKPVLHYWLAASAMKIFGPNEFGALFWTALLSVLGTLLVFDLGRKLINARTGLFAGLILATTFEFFAMGHISSMDMTLTFFFTLMLYCFGRGYLTENERNRASWFYGMYAAIALAVLTKGLIGMFLPGLVFILWMAITNQWSIIRRLKIIHGVLIIILISAPWFIAVSLANHSFPYYFFVREHFLRYTTSVHHRSQPFYFYLVVLIIGGFPWLGFFARGFKGLFAEVGKPDPARGRIYELLCLWCLVFVGFFSLSSSKLVTYILPVFPMLGLLAGRMLAEYSETGGKGRFAWGWGFMFTLTLLAILGLAGYLVAKGSPGPYFVWLLAALLIMLAGLIAALWQHRRGNARHAAPILIVAAFLFSLTLKGFIINLNPIVTAKTLADIIEKNTPAHYDLLEYRQIHYGLAFYLHKRIRLVEYYDDREYMVPDKDRGVWFLTKKELVDLWGRSPAAILVVRPGDLGQLTEAGFVDYRIIARTPDNQLILGNRAAAAGTPGGPR